MFTFIAKDVMYISYMKEKFYLIDFYIFEGKFSLIFDLKTIILFFNILEQSKHFALKIDNKNPIYKNFLQLNKARNSV